MAGQAQLSRVRLYKRREMVDDMDLYGVVSVGSPRDLGIVSEELKGQPTVKRSRTARFDRRPGTSRRVTIEGAGNINVELAPGAQCDELLEEALCEQFSTPLAISSIAISAASADNSLNGVGLFTNVVAGTWVRVLGMATATNNTDGASGRPWGAFVSSKPSNDKIILAYHTLTTEAAGATVTVTGKHIRDGAKRISSTVEREHTDFEAGDERWQAYPGQVINTVEVDMTFEEFMTMALGYVGWGPRRLALLSVWDGQSVTAQEAIAETVGDVSNNMRFFRAGGVLDGNVRVFNFNLANAVTLAKGTTTSNPVGTPPDPIGFALGTKGLTGNLNGYLVSGDGRPMTAFDRDPVDFHVQVIPMLATAPIYVATVFRAFYTDQGDSPKRESDGFAMLDLPWEAEPDSTYGDAMIQFCSLPRT